MYNRLQLFEWSRSNTTSFFYTSGMPPLLSHGLVEPDPDVSLPVLVEVDIWDLSVAVRSHLDPEFE